MRKPPQLRTSPQVRFRWPLIACMTIGLGLLSPVSDRAQTPPLGWLEIRQLQGAVQRYGSTRRAARLGDRLIQVGDGIETALRSSSLLHFDDGIGTVQVAENTKFSVSAMAVTPTKGRVTQLAVDRGQVRLRVRRFTNPESRLELKTPSGVAAVRGTEFGVSVDTAAKLAAGTLSGQVAVESKGQSVAISAGEGSSIMPGKPPSPPQPLDRQLDLNLIRVRNNPKTVWVEGSVHPLNNVRINGQWLATTESGGFTAEVIRGKGPLIVMVSNPLGEVRSFTLPKSKGEF